MGGSPNVEAVEVEGHMAKRAKGMAVPTMGFSMEDKEGTAQPQDDALVVIIRIGGFDVKRVLVD